MGLFGKKKKADVPVIDQEKYEPALRCSICTGEQTLIAVDRKSGEMHELMLVRGPGELDDICRANGLDPDKIRKIY